MKIDIFKSIAAPLLLQKRICSLCKVVNSFFSLRKLLLVHILFSYMLVVSCAPPPGSTFVGIRRLSHPKTSSSRNTNKSNSGSSRYQGGANIVVRRAKSCIGIPYRYGGTTRRGFDCSGLVLYSYQPVKVSLPRSARDQYKAGKKISFSKAKPGDLLFFKTNGRSVSHVAIYLGGDSFVHAPSTGKNVEISSVKNSYWRKAYVGAATYRR